jgi:hypothetical protein
LAPAEDQDAPVPVTARLSKRFYDKLGDDVANELVEWLNAVDTGYRQEFKELFDANFGRLEARMDAFEARVRGELEALKAELLRWMFLFWVGTMGTVLAILKL